METLHTWNPKPGVSIAYRRWHAPSPDDQPPLILVHGAASNLTRWSEFIETTTLRNTRDILRVDLRGHGQSLYRGPIGLECWSDDIAAILEKESIKKSIVGGHCLGANVAVMFGARHPGRTAGLILIEPMLRGALTGTLRRLFSFLPVLVAAIAVIRLANRIGIYRRQLPTLDLQALDQQIRARLSQLDGDQALVKRYASPLHDLRIMPAANFLQDLVEVMRNLPLDQMNAPFLALLSTGRTFSDPARTRSRLELLPGATIETIQARHWIPTEQPHAMRSAIEGWLALIQGETGG